MNTYTVLEVKGSKRTTKAEYNYAIIGKRNYIHAIEILKIELKTATYQPRILQIEKWLKEYEQKNNHIIPFEVLQWSGKLLNAQKGLNNGIFQRNYTDLKIVKTKKL
jgi:hypothetical protein